MTENELFEQWFKKEFGNAYYPTEGIKLAWEVRAELADKAQSEFVEKIAEQSAEIAHYKAHINELREALKDISTADEMGVFDSGYTAIYIARKALSKTTPQCLQEHDNEVIERCAKVCISKANKLKEFIAQDCIVGKADTGAILCAQKIRALKVNQND